MGTLDHKSQDRSEPWKISRFYTNSNFKRTQATCESIFVTIFRPLSSTTILGKFWPWNAWVEKSELGKWFHLTSPWPLMVANIISRINWQNDLSLGWWIKSARIWLLDIFSWPRLPLRKYLLRNLNEVLRSYVMHSTRC